jgi:hypothetical protein
VAASRTPYLLLTAALVVVIGAAIVFAPSGEETSLPEPLEEVFPRPGDSVVRQTAVEVDFPVGYSIELYVDGQRIPEDEVGFLQPTGEYTWMPAPGTSMEEWSGGEHTVRVVWDRTEGGRPDPGEFEWTFRVQ